MKSLCSFCSVTFGVVRRRKKKRKKEVYIQRLSKRNFFFGRRLYFHFVLTFFLFIRTNENKLAFFSFNVMSQHRWIEKKEKEKKNESERESETYQTPPNELILYAHYSLNGGSTFCRSFFSLLIQKVAYPFQNFCFHQ
jgi:hypothetical protein